MKIVKKVIAWIVCIIGFCVGIAIILTADTGYIASYKSATIAGVIISSFFGINLSILHFENARTE